MSFRFRTRLWVADGGTPWYFVTVPIDTSDEIEARSAPTKRGFGSVRVHVTIGVTSWDTSVFPASKRGAYVLPIKKQVRLGERLEVGASVAVTLALV